MSQTGQLRQKEVFLKIPDIKDENIKPLIDFATSDTTQRSLTLTLACNN